MVTINAKAFAAYPRYAITDDVPATFVAQYIMYLKVTIDPVSNKYVHDASSGYFAIPTGGVDAFVDLVIKKNQGAPNPALNAASLDFTIMYPCYVVIELDSTKYLRFRYDQNAAAISDSTRAEYFNLYHVPDTGTQFKYLGTNDLNAYAMPESDRCRVAYFSAISPSTNGKANQVDHLVLYVTNESPGSTSQDVDVDPDIQNTGHP